LLCLSVWLGSSVGVLPTPSPELNHARHHPVSADIFHEPSIWQPTRDDGAVIGSKRSHHDEYYIDDLLTDVKKRRVDPVYDSR
jgi:hypothetical protein